MPYNITTTCLPLTGIFGSDCIGDSRAIINNNFEVVGATTCALSTAVVTLSTNTITVSTTETVLPTYNSSTRLLAANVRDNSIQTRHLADNAITTPKLSAQVVTNEKLAFDGGAFSFRNKIINGDFNVWQRGTTFTNPTTNTRQYGPDRWFIHGGINTLASCTRINLTNADLLPNFSVATRAQRVAGNTGVQAIALGQVLETIHTTPLAGKTVTVSFYARRGANFSSVNNLVVQIQTGTGIDQSLSSLLSQTWTNWSSSLSQSVVLTNTFQKYTISFNIPSNITQASLLFIYNGSGTAGADDFFDVAGVQLEEGPTATPFEYRPIGTELALCQRYYEYGKTYGGIAISPNANMDHVFHTSFKQTKRTDSPAITNISFVATGGFSGTTFSAFTNVTETGFSTYITNPTQDAGGIITWTASAEL